MQISKTTQEILNSPLQVRYAIFLEIEDNKEKITKVKQGINTMFHINYSIKDYVYEDHNNKVAELMKVRLPLTEYWDEIEEREKIINHSIITHLQINKAIDTDQGDENSI